MKTPIQPILVLPVYRGGERFARALASIEDAESFFSRIVVSLNGTRSSDDAATLHEFIGRTHSKAEVICTETELPWMAHQYFWLTYLEKTGGRSTDWIYWFAHDDEIRARGIASIVDDDGGWPLSQGTVFLGPWAMRHEQGDRLFDGPRDVSLEYWTSFPVNGPTEMPVADWVAQQLVQPTYINMSGCVTTLASFQAIRGFRVPKPGGMRIEMAVAAAPGNVKVAEFADPVVITYGRPDSDRTQYARVARNDDKHIVAWLLNYVRHHPQAGIPLARALSKVSASYVRLLLRKGGLAEEDWRVRGVVEP